MVSPLDRKSEVPGRPNSLICRQKRPQKTGTENEENSAWGFAPVFN
jgi:hypothetical protein